MSSQRASLRRRTTTLVTSVVAGTTAGQSAHRGGEPVDGATFLDDLVVTQFVSGPGSNTLPMVIFSRVRLGVSPVVNALATIMVLVVALGVILSAIFMRRQEQRRKREEQMAAAGAGEALHARIAAVTTSATRFIRGERPARKSSGKRSPSGLGWEKM